MYLYCALVEDNASENQARWTTDRLGWDAQTAGRQLAPRLTGHQPTHCVIDAAFKEALIYSKLAFPVVLSHSTMPKINSKK